MALAGGCITHHHTSINVHWLLNLLRMALTITHVSTIWAFLHLILELFDVFSPRIFNQALNVLTLIDSIGIDIIVHVSSIYHLRSLFLSNICRVRVVIWHCCIPFIHKALKAIFGVNHSFFRFSLMWFVMSASPELILPSLYVISNLHLTLVCRNCLEAELFSKNLLRYGSF